MSDPSCRRQRWCNRGLRRDPPTDGSTCRVGEGEPRRLAVLQPLAGAPAPGREGALCVQDPRGQPQPGLGRPGGLSPQAGVVLARGRCRHRRSARLSQLRAARLLPQDATHADGVRLGLSGPGPCASLPRVRQGPRFTASLGTETGPQGGGGIRRPRSAVLLSTDAPLAAGYRARSEPRAGLGHAHH